MVIDDKEFEMQKRSEVNGIACTWLHHPTLKVSFVCKNGKVTWIGNAKLACYEYDNLVKSCLDQVYLDNIVDGSLA